MERLCGNQQNDSLEGKSLIPRKPENQIPPPGKVEKAKKQVRLRNLLLNKLKVKILVFQETSQSQNKCIACQLIFVLSKDLLVLLISIYPVNLLWFWFRRGYIKLEKSLLAFWICCNLSATLISEEWVDRARNTNDAEESLSLQRNGGKHCSLQLSFKFCQNLRKIIGRVA